MAQSQFHREMTDEEFARIAEFVQGSTGIKMPPHKKSLAELRLNRRLRALGMTTFGEYCEFVFEDESDEAVWLVDALTTNKTDFFREAEHFEKLLAHVVPESIAADGNLLTGRPYHVWSAGCSTGEEPYTIAMTLAEFSRDFPGFVFEVLASDISVEVLRTAKRGVYSIERTVDVPKPLLHAYFMRGSGERTDLVRVVPELRKKVRFAHCNLLDTSTYPDGPLDAIFCRNVMIYFERETQIAVLQSMYERLRPGGYLFVGHSETLHGMGLPYEHIAPTVYRRP